MHIVRVVLDVVVLQDRLQASALTIQTLLRACNFGRQAFCREHRQLPGRQFARLYALFYGVLNQSPFLPSAFVLLVVVLLVVDLFFWWIWMCDFLLRLRPRGRIRNGCTCWR